MRERCVDVLSRRERYIMDILYRRRRATAREIMADISGRPSNSTVRSQLRVLELKGQVRHFVRDRTFVFEPVIGYASARRSAMRRLIDTFFDSSPMAAMSFLETFPDSYERPRRPHKLSDRTSCDEA